MESTLQLVGKPVRTPTLEIAYEVAGPEDGMPVVLLHGWPDDPRTWDAIAPVLAKSGYRVLAPWLRGFGPTRFRRKTSIRSGQISALAQDLFDFIEALRLRRPVLIGHDWGARAAGSCTGLAHGSGQVRALCLLSTGYGTNNPGQSLSLPQIEAYWYHWFFATERGRRELPLRRREFTEHIWRRWLYPGHFDESAFAGTVTAFDNPDWPAITLHSYRHRWGHAAGDPAYLELERRLDPPPHVDVPCLVLHGADDPVSPPVTSEGKEAYFEASYQRHLLERCGHFPQREQPRALLDKLLPWLESLD
ncbi:MAG: alpha/beta hydrolase [Burkholderiaceae bacterium]|nr:alpha/beta hydrolase [Burkholderiaceae bacterium]